MRRPGEATTAPKSWFRSRNWRSWGPPPVDDITTILTPQQIAGAKGRLLYSAIGGPETIKRQLADFIALTGVDELMITGMMFDNAARIRSLEIVGEIREQL